MARSLEICRQLIEGTPFLQNPTVHYAPNGDAAYRNGGARWWQANSVTLVRPTESPDDCDELALRHEEVYRHLEIWERLLFSVHGILIFLESDVPKTAVVSELGSVNLAGYLEAPLVEDLFEDSRGY